MNLSPSLFRIRQFAPWALVLVSAAVAVAAYLQLLHFPFVSDDILYLAENPKLADLNLPTMPGAARPTFCSGSSGLG